MANYKKVNYRPDLSNMKPFVLLIPTSKTVSGVAKREYPNPSEVSEDMIFFATFKTYGGTETVVNGLHSIIDTAILECYFRDDIKSDCRIAKENGAIYDIINEPEDINENHQFLKFKVRRVKGKA